MGLGSSIIASQTSDSSPISGNGEGGVDLHAFTGQGQVQAQGRHGIGADASVSGDLLSSVSLLLYSEQTRQS